MALTLAEMTTIVNAGGSVMWNEQVLTTTGALPTAQEITDQAQAELAALQEGENVKTGYQVLASAYVDAGDAAKQALYTVPAGYKAVIKSLTARDPGGAIGFQQETATIVDDETLQVESTAVIAAGGVTGDGDIDVIVTAAGMNNSPKTVSIAVTSAAQTTQDLLANALRIGLAADTDVDAFFTVSGATNAIILTAKAFAANDATMNIDLDDTGSTATGMTDDDTSDNDVAGVASGITSDGDLDVIVTAAGMSNSPKTVNVAVTGAGETSSDLMATAIRAALDLDADVSAWFDAAGGTGSDIILTKSDSDVNDATMNIDIDLGGSTAAGFDDAPTSANTTAGADIAGTVGFGGDASAVDFVASADLTPLSSSLGYMELPASGSAQIYPSATVFGAIMGTPTSSVFYHVDIIGYLVKN